MLYATQWTNPREPASGSLKTIAKLWVPAGGSDQSNWGDLLSPVQAKSRGITPPSSKAGLVSVNGICVSVGGNGVAKSKVTLGWISVIGI
jgi:hypothetical protein